jgi:hypothetical protein
MSLRRSTAFAGATEDAGVALHMQREVGMRSIRTDETVTSDQKD